MRRFYSEQKIGDAKTFAVSGQEANHIVNVIRLKAGDKLIVFDGSGIDYICEIVDTKKNDVLLKVLSHEVNSDEPKTRITLYCSSIKKDRLDYSFQKTCEIGISSYFVFDSARSIRKIGNADKLLSHLKRIAVEVSKQCGRSKIPELGVLSDSSDVANRISRHDCVIFAYEEEKTTHICDVIPKDSYDIGVIIGPEGGFEPEEAKLFIDRGARVCSLGKLILRAETAAVFSVSALMCAKEYK